MADFIRPEVRRKMIRYRQPLIGLAFLLLGLWWAMGNGLIIWLGGFLCFVGALLIVEGLRRARLLRGGGFGPDFVDVDERQITWFAADVGGSISVDSLAWVRIQTFDDRPANWIFQQNDGQRLSIPSDAAGADKIIDALAPLKGIDLELAVKAMAFDGEKAFVIWRANNVQPINKL